MCQFSDWIRKNQPPHGWDTLENGQLWCFNVSILIYIWYTYDDISEEIPAGRLATKLWIQPELSSKMFQAPRRKQCFLSPMFNVLSLQCSIYCHITKVCVYNVNFTSEHGPRLTKWWTLLSLDFKLKIENLWGALYSLTWIVSTWVVPEYGRLSEYPETLSTVWSLVWTLRASNLVTDCAIDSNSTNS